MTPATVEQIEYEYEAEPVEVQPTAKEKFVAGLREAADFVEKSDLPDDGRYTTCTVYLFCQDAAKFGRLVAALGSCEKAASENYLNARKRIGAVEIEVTIPREQACKKVKVGERVIPAQPERVLAAEPERVEDIMEWSCPESFLGLGRE